MTNRIPNAPPLLPHHKLVAYQVAVELLLAVKRANIRDAKLRDEATRAAKSAALNSAEGAGRVTRADKARAFAIARGEAVEATWSQPGRRSSTSRCHAWFRARIGVDC